MKNTILTITFILLSIISNSQVITVSVKGLQNYFRPKNLTLQECQQQNLIDYKEFGVGDCDYIFDLNNNKFKMVCWNGYVYENEILVFEKNGNNLKIQVSKTMFFVTNQTETKETIFLIEYYDLDKVIEGRFAKQQDFVMVVK
jgi:hypothetical protein